FARPYPSAQYKETTAVSVSAVQGTHVDCWVQSTAPKAWLERDENKHPFTNTEGRVVTD
ncbi:MAG: hypothetical protein ACI8P9_005437, partial [Parasphingorhabdus sp.]